MKLTLLAFALCSLSSLFASEIILGQKVINLGHLTAEDGGPLSHKVIVTRDVTSPKKVELNFSYNYNQDVCVEFEQRYICRNIPTNNCFPTPANDFCRVVWQNVCKFENFCIRSEVQSSIARDTLVLDFSQASILTNEYSEQLKITIDQKELTEKLKYGAEVLSSDSEYLISGRGPLSKKGLLFKEKAILGHF